MNKYFRTHIIIIMALSWFVADCTAPEDSGESEESLVKKVNVHAKEMRPQNFQSYVRLVGTITSDNDIEISAEVTGRVEKYFIDKGDRIKKGDPILKIDDEELKAERDRLEAITERSYQNYKRLEDLYETDSVGSEIEVINARAEYRQNKAALQSTEIKIKKTLVNAPFNAVLEEKMVNEGEMAAAALGTTLFRLVSSDILKVRVGVPARYADAVMPGNPAKIWFDTNASDTLRQPIRYVGNSIDPQSRTFSAEIPIKNKKAYKIDMIANVRLQTMERKNVIVVNQQYINQTDDGSYLLYIKGTHNGNDIALERRVELGLMFQNRVIIEKGLNYGDQLLTTGSSFLKDSTRIEVVNTEESNIVSNR